MFAPQVGPLVLEGGEQDYTQEIFGCHQENVLKILRRVPCLKRASHPSFSKVVISKCAFKLSFSQTALLETYVLSCMDTGHSYQAFQSTLFHHGPLLRRA